MTLVLAYTSSGQIGEIDVVSNTVKFPFFISDGSPADIGLTSLQKLPFFLTDGSSADVGLTT